MTETLPAILTTPHLDRTFPSLVADEIALIHQAKKLFDAEFYDHTLLDIWNASIHNLRRRVEAYDVTSSMHNLRTHQQKQLHTIQVLQLQIKRK